MILGVFFSAVIVILSTAVYTFLIWWADRHEKEPLHLFAAALFWGAVPAVALSLVLELAFQAGLPDDTQFGWRLFGAGIAGPIIEESAKALALLGIYTFWRMEFDGVLDGIVYGALVGFGFAMTENFLYFVGALEKGVLVWSLIVLLRQFIFGLNHAFFTSFVGIGFGLMRLSKHARRWAYPLVGLLLAIFFHAVHNLAVSLSSVTMLAFLIALVADAGGVLIVFLVLLLAVQREARVIAEELVDEVGNTLTAEEYQHIRRRALLTPYKGNPSPEERRRLRKVRRLAIELALKKRQLRRKEDDRDVKLRIAQLRAELVSLRKDKPVE